MTPSSPTLLGALDPTYSLVPYRAVVSHYDLPVYLRLYYLIFGTLVIPRTYLMHGRNNPFFELYQSGNQGKEELQAFLSESGALISGHNGTSFTTLDGHLEKTKAEHHPLVFGYNQRFRYATEIQDWIPTESIKLQDSSKVIIGFPRLFKKHFLSYEHTNVKKYDAVDAKLKRFLAERNPNNSIKYGTDWGRNEVCDYIRSLPARDQMRSRLADCAVASYQHTFAQTFPNNSNVFLNSQALSNSTEESTDFTERLHDDLRDGPKLWEVSLTKLSECPWRTIRAESLRDNWSKPRYEFMEALRDRNREKALDALDRLMGELRKEFNPKDEGSRAIVRMIKDNIPRVGPVVGIVISIIGNKNDSDLELYIVNGLGLLTGADWLYTNIQSSRRKKRLRFHLDYLYDDWKSNLPRI
ncbi:hypothetical protein [Methyloglobulus sp.]|uniref:hypothetical protein n=1 Tax=Methyloglobulus sp. TaxID=2518622 RepID=UPI00398A2246